MNRNTPRALVAMSVLLVAVLLAGCAAKEPKRPEVETRSQARWDAHIAGDLGAVYEFLSPARRSSVNSLQYQRALLRRQVGYTGAEVTGSDCLEDSCKVSVLINIKVIRPIPGMDVYEGEQEIIENWVRSDGEWWYVPKK